VAVSVAVVILLVGEALFEAGLELLPVEAPADEDDLGDALLVVLPRVGRGPKVDGLVHPLENKLGVALPREGEDPLGPVDVRRLGL